MVVESEHPAVFGPDAPARPVWRSRTARAIAFATSDRDTVIVALAGYLVRGGILVLLIPSVVLPSLLGLAAFTGVDAFGIDGRASVWLLLLVAAVAIAASVWLLLAVVVGSLVDVWMIEATLDTAGHGARRPRPLPGLGLILDLAGLRILCSLPLIGSILAAAPQVYTAGYNELTNPTNLTTPFVARVFGDAAPAFALIGAAWLVSEVVGAIAVRRVVLTGDGAWRSLGATLAQIARRPATTGATVTVSYGAAALAAAIAVVATAAAFDLVRVAARNDAAADFPTAALHFVLLLLASVGVGVAWVVGLAVSGIASAWRSAAFTEETAAALSADGPDPTVERLGLSGHGPERSGD